MVMSYQTFIKWQEFNRIYQMSNCISCDNRKAYLQYKVCVCCRVLSKIYSVTLIFRNKITDSTEYIEAFALECQQNRVFLFFDKEIYSTYRKNKTQ